MNILALLAAIATDAPHLLADTVKAIHDVSTGKGGLGKVATVAGDVEQTVVDVAAAAAGVQASQVYTGNSQVNS